MQPRTDAIARSAQNIPPKMSGGWTVAECRLSAGKVSPAGRRKVPAALLDELANKVHEKGIPTSALPLAHHLAFVGPPGPDGKARLIFIADDALRELMNTCISPASIAPAELRLLKQLLAGYALHEAAEADDVGYETKRSQYKSLAKKLHVRSQLDLAGTALTQIMLHLGEQGRAKRKSTRRK